MSLLFPYDSNNDYKYFKITISISKLGQKSDRLFGMPQYFTIVIVYFREVKQGLLKIR